ncbi:YozE family protein [Halolactibacillus sp. JCM 19043]|uniref:YozE family protein n=1 Tax=Halolactibacillus sp. JCM 19043 TaxID=1460638 RepID=UPI0007858335|nr:YozE family protein [Halolactibacillus sp. JCM 19043]
MNFKEWLMHFKDVNRPIGDLAKDVAVDDHFPISSDKEEIKEHLEKYNASETVMDIFECVYDFYKVEKHIY